MLILSIKNDGVVPPFLILKPDNLNHDFHDFKKSGQLRIIMVQKLLCKESESLIVILLIKNRATRQLTIPLPRVPFESFQRPDQVHRHTRADEDTLKTTVHPGVHRQENR